MLLTQTALPQQQPDAVQVINVRNALIPVSVLVFHRHQFATLQLEHAYNVLWMQIVLWLKLRDVVATQALVLLARAMINALIYIQHLFVQIHWEENAFNVLLIQTVLQRRLRNVPQALALVLHVQAPLTVLISHQPLYVVPQMEYVCNAFPMLIALLLQQQNVQAATLASHVQIQVNVAVISTQKIYVNHQDQRENVSSAFLIQIALLLQHQSVQIAILVLHAQIQVIVLIYLHQHIYAMEEHVLYALLIPTVLRLLPRNAQLAAGLVCHVGIPATVIIYHQHVYVIILVQPESASSVLTTQIVLCRQQHAA